MKNTRTSLISLFRDRIGQIQAKIAKHEELYQINDTATTDERFTPALDNI